MATSSACTTMATGSDGNASATKHVIGVAQLCATNNKLHNLRDMAKCAAWAKQRQARMLFFPENCGFMGGKAGETLQHAEPPVGTESPNAAAVTQYIQHLYQQTLREGTVTDKNGNQTDGDDSLSSLLASRPDSSTTSSSPISLVDGLRTLARTSQLWISIGGMHVLGAPPHPVTGQVRFYNTHVILDDMGEVRAVYRKMHLFDVSIPGKVNLMESNSTAAGREIVVCDTPVGRLGLSTCYDMRFPELYAALVKKGAQILLMPSAFTVPTGQAHWHVLLRARAIECQTFVIAAAQYGQHNAKRSSYGHALVVDPWGVVLADAGGVDSDAPVKPSLVTAEIDSQEIDSIRLRMPVQQHRAAAEVQPETGA